MDLIALSIMRMFTLFSKVPIVIMCHCGPQWWHLKHAPSISAKIINFADKIMVITQDQKNLFTKNGVNEQKVIHVKSLIEEPFFDQVNQPGTDREKLVGLYLGRIGPEKGTETLINAMTLIDHLDRPDIRLVGPISAEYKKKINQQLAKHSLTDSIRLIPPISGVTNRKDMIDDADFIVHPTLSDVKPLAVIEAMGRERPIIASSLPGTTELLDGCGVEFHPGDHKELAKALKDMQENGVQSFAGDIKRARSIALQNSPNSSAREIEGQLNQVIATAHENR